MPLIAKVGLAQFLTCTSWSPTSKPPQFGILPMIVGSLWLTFGSLVIGVPLGLAVAIFMVDLAPPQLSALMRPAIQLLAGIPSVIYGFIGLTLLAPLIRSAFGFGEALVAVPLLWLSPLKWRRRLRFWFPLLWRSLWWYRR